MLINILLAFCPSKLNIFIRRRFLNQNIGDNCKLGIFSYIKVKDLVIGNNVKISPFAFITADSFSIGDYSSIEKFTRLINRKISIGKHSSIGRFNYIGGDFHKSSVFEMGDHSAIFSMCYFDPSYGIYIGNNVGTGGYTLIFTHGYWGDFLKGRPRTVGKVVIEDDVWLAWRVFVPPDVLVKQGSIVSANSFLTRTVKENSLMVGSPAKSVSNLMTYDINEESDFPKVKKRAISICKSFVKNLQEEWNVNLENKFSDETKYELKDNFHILLTANSSDFSLINEKSIVFNICSERPDTIKAAAFFDYRLKKATFNSDEPIIEKFSLFLRTFGIRMYI